MPCFASLYRHNILYCKRFRLLDAERPAVAFPREAGERDVLDGSDESLRAGVTLPGREELGR